MERKASESGLRKRYVEVRAELRRGRMEPVEVRCGDKAYEIDRVLGVAKKASALGGHGLRWECVILGKVRYLFQELPYDREPEKWFVESRM